MINKQCGNKYDTPRTFRGDDDNCLIYNNIGNLAGIEDLSEHEGVTKQWFVMRDLKRPNAKLPAYKQLEALEIIFFTPMRWRLTVRQGKRVREEVPYMSDLLFVHDTQADLDPIVEKIPTLQYRYQRGKGYRKPMVVPNADMERFIRAVNSTETPQYYLPGELTPVMYGRRIRIVGGGLDGYEGRLLTTRGSRTKRILIELPTWLTAAIEVNPEFIQVL